MTPFSTRRSKRTMLLIGGTGFLGTNLRARLVEDGHRVLTVSRSFDPSDEGSSISVRLEDTAAIIAVVRTERIDAVVHLACQMLPSSNEAAYFEELARINMPAIRLARELAALDVAFVFFSSGGTVYGPVDKLSVNEDEPCRPISLYGQAKLEMELHLGFLARTLGLRLLVLRPSNPYGAHQPLRGTQGLVSVILGRIADHLPVDVWGDGSATRDYIDVEDATRAIAGLIERNAQGVFNIGSGVGHSLMEVVRSVERTTGRPVALRFHSSRVVDVPRLVLDVGRLAALGLHRARSLDEGVGRYAAQLGMARAD